jgi:hypothetical protein
MTNHRFTIPGTLPGLNEVTQANRTHWAAGAKQKRTLTEGIAWVLRDQARGLTKPIGKAVFTFHWFEPDMRRDPDNIRGGGTKFIMDALKQAGIIASDGWKGVAGFGGDTFAVDKDNPHVTIDIAEVGE